MEVQLELPLTEAWNTNSSANSLIETTLYRNPTTKIKLTHQWSSICILSSLKRNTTMTTNKKNWELIFVILKLIRHNYDWLAEGSCIILETNTCAYSLSYSWNKRSFDFTFDSKRWQVRKHRSICKIYPFHQNIKFRKICTRCF